MPDRKFEPFVAVQSMGDLLSLAYAMEREAIAGYSELAERMRRENQPSLAAVFDRLVAEESQHLENVMHWSARIGATSPDFSTTHWEPTETFDDEGAGTIAPELLSAYRAFSMAVRNEERAFVFWTYVAALAPSDALREAAEQMAREELGHVATLRRERRQAFHAQRAAPHAEKENWTLAFLERRLSDQLLDAAAIAGDDGAESLNKLAREAGDRADNLSQAPFGDSLLLQRAPAVTADRMAPLCELLLDCYLDFGDRLADEKERNRAQEFAAGAVHCLAAIRSASV
ncbi:MAG TPA: rubrerythrin family protein [Aurantimonas coralicida]|uniref:Rubrerythrin family protein n=2 Tax=root TaxID=1 RepID=A0A9C9TI08_9HYPH|nr:rubrerythrin family protein [Aurantimonas coralicida]HEU01368.1 rubrerythrin family protein [Aurantimonas coralicida]